MLLSRLSGTIEIPKILSFTNSLNQRIAQGEAIDNLTIGDFNPSIFPVPEPFARLIAQAYNDGHTNYPGAFGLTQTRRAAAQMINRYCSISLSGDDYLIASGTRPFIYSAYRAIVDPGDKVVYPVPSWNNDQYAKMLQADICEVETRPESGFMPSAAELEPHLKQARLLALCSPQNPTGTVFSKQGLSDICELIVAENRRRSAGEKPLYVFFDQVYWLLTHGETPFYHALQLCPDIRPYAIFIDGMSKAFAATGVRVGWASGPDPVLAKMRAIIAYMGAWAPKAEQVAAAGFFADDSQVDAYIQQFRQRLKQRLNAIYDGVKDLKSQGYPVDAIKPQASIYLSVKLDIAGKTTATGQTLDNHETAHQYILDEAQIGILPFSWFGAKTHDSWFRVSVGALHTKQIPVILEKLASALSKLR